MIVVYGDVGSLGVGVSGSSSDGGGGGGGGGSGPRSIARSGQGGGCSVLRRERSQIIEFIETEGEGGVDCIDSMGPPAGECGVSAVKNTERCARNEEIVVENGKIVSNVRERESCHRSKKSLSER
jgi:hypothetical protein